MNNKYEILILKGFPGHYKYKDLFKWLSNNKLNANIINFGPQVRGVDYYVNKFKKIVIKNYSEKRIIILGFSMGGLIAVRFAQKNSWKNIEKIITFATPFKGSSKTEKWKIIPALADMSPESKLLKEISKVKIPTNKLICVSGKTDILVNNSGTFLKGSKHIILNIPIHRNSDTQVFKKIKPILEKEL